MTLQNYTIRPLSVSVGAEFEGIDLARPLDDADITTIRDTLAERCIVLFRGQNLTPQQHIDFSARFGELAIHPLDAYQHPDHPELFMVSNLPVDGKPSDTRNVGRFWHSDLCYTKTPSMGSLLYAREVPAIGGDTVFANMYRALDTLSEPFRNMLEGMHAVHDYSRSPGLRDRDPETSARMVAKVPPVEHPLIVTHPESGKRSLFLSENFTCRIVGMTDKESAAILDHLIANATRMENNYRHQWRAGDLIFWDNGCGLHYALADFDVDDPANRRHMHRTTIVGEAPQP